MSHFGIGFLEEFVLLALSGTFLGVCLYFLTSFLVRWSRDKVGFAAASGPILLLALFFFVINIPRIRAAVVEGLPYFLAMGFVAAGVVAVARRRGVVGKGIGGVAFLTACAALMTFSIFQFATARHSAYQEGELIALVETRPTDLPAGHTIANGVSTVTYHEPVDAVHIQLHYLEDGEPAEPFQTVLPGQRWGIGGELLHVRQWMFLFGDRTLCRLTGVDAKFDDPTTATVGFPVPGYDPDSRPLEADIPIVQRKVKDLCGIEETQLGFDQFIYQRVEKSGPQYWGIYVKPGAGFVPKALSLEEFSELRRTRFLDAMSRLL